MKQILLALSVPFLLSAQQMPGGQIPMTLRECIERALQQNPVLLNARARVAAAEAKRVEARSALLPQLRLAGRAAQLSSVPEGFIEFPIVGRRSLFPVITHSYVARLSLQQPIFTGFRLARTLDIADDQLSAAGEELTRDVGDLRLAVTTAYWNLHRAQQIEQVIAFSVEQLTERLRDVRNFARQGLATEGDILKVQAQRSDIQLKQVEAESARRLAAMTLNNLIGLPLETDITPAEQPPAPTENHDEENLSSLMQRGKRQRPELHVITLREAMSEAGIRAARGAWYPQVMLNASYEYARPNQRIIPPSDRWEASWDVSVSVQWNIWDWWATPAQTAQAEAILQQTQATKTQVEEGIALEIAQQYFKLREAFKKVAVAADGVKQATESHRMTAERFKQGLVTNTEMLDAETALLQARLSEIQATLDYAIARARLKRAVGDSE